MKLISAEAEKALYDIFYHEHFTFGRNKLYAYARSKGIIVSRSQVMDWLKKQYVHQIYSETKTTKDIRSTILKRSSKQIGIDLIDMQNTEYKGYRYILTGVDLFSKKSYARPLKNKTEAVVTKAMQDLITKDIKHVGSIRSDRGSEFISTSFKEMLKKNNVAQVLSLPSKPQSNGAIERFNKTLKRALRITMKTTQLDNWPVILKQIIKNYNNAVHSVTKMVPNEVHNTDDRKLNKEIKSNIKKSVQSKNETDTAKFKVGDKVRVKLDSNDKDRSGENWSKQLYSVYQVTVPRTSFSSVHYIIRKGVNGEIQKKKYYNNDLLFIPAVHNAINEPEKYTVSKIVEPVMSHGQPAYVIKWLGYPASENTIELRKELIKDVPKLVSLFEKRIGIKWNENGRFTIATSL